MLETGGRVPADCLLLEGADLVCNEGPKYHDVEEYDIPKQGALSAEEGEEHDSFLLSQSLISKGVGTALVCAVGERTRLGI
jgi:magnesium-transporting ATPase (P-type)